MPPPTRRQRRRRALQVGQGVLARFRAHAFVPSRRASAIPAPDRLPTNVCRVFRHVFLIARTAITSQVAEDNQYTHERRFDRYLVNIGE